jgi:uncharacterized protein
MSYIGHQLVHALSMAFAMFWEIFWALALGFFISGIVQAVVSKKEMIRLLPDDRSPSIWKALGLGAASSSCSYAAVAITRSLIRKGANFTAAMAFEMASTNLVAELAIIMAILIGWQFAVAEFVGAPIMVFLLVLLFRRFLSQRLVTQAKHQAAKGIAGVMEGHAEMDMSITEGPLLRRITSDKGRTSISHYFVMDWVSVWKDVVGGLLIAGALAAWVPRGFWNAFFFTSHPTLAKFWGPIAGPIVAILSFVCSVGNVPLAAVLWNGGSSFGGVIAFIFADLLVIPVLNIYRKYYGLKMTGFLLVTMYAAMVAAALIVEGLFGWAGLVPHEHKARIVEAAIQWNYTTILNIIFGALAILLLVRFFKTGGVKMLKMMDEMPHRQGPEAESANAL